MTAKKKSFFELLTGVEDEEVITTQSETMITETDDMQIEDFTPDSTASVEVESDRSVEALGEEHEEGQLTIDVYQTDKHIVIQSPVAGVAGGDLDVSITNDMVTIKGKRSREDEVNEGDYYFQELYWGSFSRSVILPTEVQAGKVKASLKNGILTIRLPKVKKESARKIQIEEL